MVKDQRRDWAQDTSWLVKSIKGKTGHSDFEKASWKKASDFECDWGWERCGGVS